MYTMYIWHIQHIAAQLSNRNNLKVLRVYVCAYLFPGGILLLIRGDGREGAGKGRVISIGPWNVLQPEEPFQRPA
jgi:hypothetical protein